jgi:hypothetical protein
VGAEYSGAVRALQPPADAARAPIIASVGVHDRGDLAQEVADLFIELRKPSTREGYATVACEVST